MTETAAQPVAMTLTNQVKERLMAELTADPEAIWPPNVAAAFLGVSKDTLKYWRRSGEGPQYIRLSRTRIGYQKRSLREWLLSRACQSTAEAAVAASASDASLGAKP